MIEKRKGSHLLSGGLSSRLGGNSLLGDRDGLLVLWQSDIISEGISIHPRQARESTKERDIAPPCRTT